jgi:Xaa-Pro aminopeptidase
MEVFSDRLAALRAKMQEFSLDAYFVLNGDAHNSEYIAEPDKRMPWLSNFAGSNGQMLVTMEAALLWTDGRYWIACEKCLPPDWSLMKMGGGDPRWFDWVSKNLPSGAQIGYDPLTFPANASINREEYFKGYN